jgi:hypothetical protein
MLWRREKSLATALSPLLYENRIQKFTNLLTSIWQKGEEHTFELSATYPICQGYNNPRRE